MMQVSPRGTSARLPNKENMPEIHNLEPKHLTGKGGIGKGSKLRHGADLKAFAKNYDKLNWNNYPEQERGSR